MSSWAVNLYRWITRTVHPDEADDVANRLRLAAMSLQSNAYLMESVKSDLDQNWSGRAKDRFFEDYGFSRLPKRIEDLGQEIEAHSEQVRRITVTITERVPLGPDEPQWQ